MRVNVIQMVLIGIVLLVFAILIVPNSNAFILLESTSYVLGHDIAISLNITSMDGYRLEVSHEDAVFVYIGKEKQFVFTPKTPGFYSVKLINVSYDVVKESTEFAVVGLGLSLFTDKKTYLLGEEVLIFVDLGHLTSNYNLSIGTERELFHFLGEIQNPLNFIPRSVGNYQINLYGNSSSVQKNFTVIAFDTSKAKKSLVKITSSKKVYTIGESVELRLTLPKEDFQFYITSGSNIYRYFGIPNDLLVFVPKDIGEYTVSIEQAGNILAEYKFSIVPRAVVDIDKILQHVEYSFPLSENVVIELDFSDKLNINRNVIEAALKSSVFEQVTAYVQDNHLNPHFSIGIQHIEYDKFRITILANQNIPAGIYKLVVASRYNKKTYKKTVLFNFGLTDEEIFFKELAIKKAKLNQSIFINKTNYNLGEFVYIKTNLSNVKVLFENQIVLLSSEFVPELVFAPPFTGDYIIKAQEGSGNAVASFSVFEATATESFLNETQLGAEIGKPVKWKKMLKLKNSEADAATISLLLPNESENISILSDDTLITGALLPFSKNTSIIYFNDSLMPFEEKQYLIDFQTPSPQKEELENETDKFSEKNIRVSSKASVHYTNVQSYSDIEESKANQVRIFWVVNGSEVNIVNLTEFNVTLSDTNNNGLIDRVSWNIPNLSEQNFKIKIIKAIDLLLDAKDSKNNIVPSKYELYSDGMLVKSETNKIASLLNISKKHDLEIRLNNNIKKISINDIKGFSDINLSFGVDDVDVDIDKSENWKKIYAIAPNIDFANGTVTINATGFELYKCKDWNFNEQKCFGNWQKIMDLIPGNEYNFTLSPEDPGYAETGLASVNTNKSIYHPNEEVKILMVVLDKNGHLVSNANVILNVTKPDKSATIFSTSDNTVIEKERGIYEAKFTDTNLEGNYSLLVKALGNNVNDSMSSYFIIKQFYEFDILRNAPVTTDPWQGPFTSSIKIVSLTDVSAFNFSEKLSINFTIIDTGNSTITIENDKQILMWYNLNNHSIVSYTTSPPKITPELWELGPALVNYDNGKFEEPKPWFLAVDPLCSPSCSTNTKGESGEAILSTTQTQLDVDLINEYVLNKTFIIARHHGAATPTGVGIPPNEHTGTVRFLDNNTIRIDRYATGTRDSRATYSIIQADNIQVWNFTKELADTQSSVNLTLSPNLPSNYNSKCFVELWRNTRVDSADVDCTSTAQVVSNLTNTTNLNLRRFTAPAGCAGSIAANTSGFVVCFLDSSTVQTNDTVADIESGTVLGMQNSVNRSNAWLTFNYMVDDDGLEQISVRGNITADNQLTFYRNTGETTAGTVTLRWYVIEFEAGRAGFVEREGRTAVSNTVTELNLSFSNSYNINRTLAHCSENFDAGEGNQYPRVWWSAFFVNATTIKQNRGRTSGAGGTTDHQCQAIQWPSTTSLETGIDDVKPRINASLNNSEPQINYVVNFTANVSDETGLSFCQFIINQSSGVKEYFNQSLSGTNAQCSQNFTIALDTGSVINFTVIVNDTANNINSTQQIITVRGSPIVTLDSPANNTIETDLNVSLKCSATDDRDIINLTIYTNSTGQFIENQTFNVSGTSNTDTSYIFNLSLTEAKVFIWNCLSFDNETQQRFASANFTVMARVTTESFTDITPSTNISNRTSGRGTCAEDYNKNGLMDVILLGDNKGGINLFNNTGSNIFKNDTTSLTTYSLAGRGCSFGDFNNNEFVDFATASDLILYKNNKNNTFNCTDSEDDGACAGAVLPLTSFTGKSIQWLDYNDDSYLDLFAPDTTGVYIFKNNGSNFSLVSVGSDTIDEYTAVADYDNDGNLDLFAVDGTVHIIYKNNGNSTFTSIDAASIGLPNRTRGTGDDAEDFHWGFGDYDNDDDLDVFITSTGVAERNFFENDGDGTFTEKTTAAGLPTDDVGTNPVWGDYNNDGHLDLLIGGKGIYKNNKDKTFSEVSSNLSITSLPESVQFADIDNDGDLDIVGQNKSGVSILYRNDLNDPNYLKILVRGLGNTTTHNFSNIDAIGAKIRVYNSSNNLVCFREVSGGSSYGQAPKIQHCGLKPLLTYNVSVEFPSGLAKNTTITPSSVTLSIGGTTLTQTIQINESENAPITRLVLPAAGDVDSDGLDVVFTCNATDDIDIANISLYHNASGTFRLNQTAIFSTNNDVSNSTNFTANFSVGVIAWNCLTYDAAGLSAFAVQNRTLTTGTDTLSIDVYADSTTYGTNEVAKITVNTTNSAKNPINATTKTDIVFGSTTTAWWNNSYTFRKPIFLNYTENLTNVTVEVNVTGLGNNIVSCVNDTRVVRNESTTNYLINRTILDGDNSTYCMIRFKADVHNANESNYHVYYKNNTGSAPGFTISESLLVKNVQKGIAQLSSTATSITVNISAVNTSKSFLVFNLQADDNRPDRTLVRGNLSNSTMLRFLREASGTSMVIQWYVVEFESGINVQRGSTPITTALTDIAINSVDLNKSFPLTSWDNSGGAFGSDDFLRANLTSPTNLRLTAVATNTVDVEWQVIEFTKDTKVQKGDINFASTDATQTATIEAININRSFVIATWTASANGLGENFIRAGFVDSTTVIFERQATGTTIGLTYFVVELNTSRVLSDTLTFTGTETVKNANLNSIDINKSVAFLSGNQKGGSSSFTTNDNPGTGWYTTNITNSTNLEIRRGIDTESSTSNITYFVVEFYGANSVKGSLLDEQKFIKSDLNDTGSDGLHLVNLSTANQTIGLYSVVSVGTKVSYNDAKDVTTFNITSGGEVPVVTVNFPTSGSTINNAEIDLNVTTSKNANCKYSANQLFDYDTQGTLFTTTGSTSHSTNLGALAQGSYTYYVKCRDSQGNTNNNENQGSTAFTVDRTSPTITLNRPLNNSNQTSSTITFSWTATDNIDTSLSCNLTVNGVVRAENMQSQSGVQEDFPIVLSNGNYTWNVSCIDNAPNYNTSVTNRFSLSIIDLVLSIQTLNTSYKQNRYVNLTKRSISQSGDIEDSTQSTLFPINTHVYVPNETTNRSFYIEDDCNAGSVPPSDGPDPSCGGVHLAFTTANYNAVSVSDDVDASMTCGANDEDYLLYNLTVDEDLNAISQINWSFEGALSATAGTNLTFFLWNYSSSSWSRCAANMSSTTDTFVNCSVAFNASYFLNSTTKNTYFLTQCEENSGSARTVTTDLIQFVVKYYTNKTDGNSSGNYSYINYTFEDSNNLTKLSDINVKITVTAYNSSISNSKGNSLPDLEVTFYNGSNYSYSKTCSLDSITNSGSKIPANCSVTVTNKTILSAWNDSTNRRFRIRGIALDQAIADQDYINWTNVFVELHTPSEIENIGEENYTTRLLLQVLRNNGQGFIVHTTIYNSTLTIASNSSRNLSDFWNTDTFFTNNYPLGNYTAYAALIGGDNLVILNGDGQSLNDTYFFTIDYLRINITSPLNDSIQDAAGFYVNVSLENITFKSGGNCSYSIDGKSNITMTNESQIRFFNFTNPVEVAQHYIQAYCNDTSREFSSSDIHNFSVQDLTSPIVSLVFPLNNSEVANGNVTLVYNVTDFTSNISNCTLILDFQDNVTNFTVVKNINQTFNVTGLTSEQHRWQVRCADNSSNKNIGLSEEFVFLVGIDNSPPVVTLQSPANNTFTQNNDVVFKYTAFDEPVASNIANCSLILNNKINHTNKTIFTGAGEVNNFTVINMPVADYNWSVNCTDTSQNRNTGSSKTFNLSIGEDTDFPIVILISPANNITDTDGSILFSYNVTDLSGAILNCTIIINGTINQTSTSIQEDTAQTFTVSGFDDGIYNWRVNCTDDSFQRNTNGSSIRNFTVTKLLSMKVHLSIDKSIYEKGTEFNETAIINTTTRDSLNTLINATVTSDVIRGNTSLSWWNASWSLRKSVLINETTNINRTNVPVSVNITTLNGNISSCNELRIVYNKSQTHAVIPRKIISNDSTYCFVMFNANVTANSTHENNYYAYYNNTNAIAPTDSIVFEPQEYVNTTFEEGNESFVYGDDFYGGTSNSAEEDGSRGQNQQCPGSASAGFCLNVSLNTVPDATGPWSGGWNITFNITEPNVIVNITFNFTLMLSVTTEATEFINLSYRNISSRAVITGARIVGDALNPPPQDHYLNGTINYTEFIATTGLYSFDVGCFLSDVNAIEEVGSCWIDNVRINILNGSGAGIKASYPLIQELRKREINDTGLDGIFTYQFNSTNHSTDTYSVVSTATNPSYNTNYNNTLFTIRTDITPPLVNLVSPQDSFISATGNITFIYNVTDIHSNISDCNLIIDSVIVQTNTTVTENTRQNFTRYEIGNGAHTWQVNCTDGLGNKNGSGIRNFEVQVDTLGPGINLIEPPDTYNDTNGILEFRYSASDDFNGIANCSLLINNTANQTVYNVTEAVTQTFYSNITDGVYNWSVRCTDNSSNFNVNTSLTRRFNVIVDTAPPIITLIFPQNDSQQVNSNITFIYNVTDVISNISNCSIFLDGKLNITNVTVTEGINQTFNITGIADGNHNWSVLCFDGSENNNSAMTANFTFLLSPDATPPVITLTNPPNGTQDPDGNITLNYNVTDFASDIKNCTLILNGTLNQSALDVPEGIEQSFSLVNLDNSTYSWSVNCTDTALVQNTGNSSTRFFIIGADTTAPTITLESPSNNSEDTNGVVTYQYNVVDFGSNIKNCSLLINNTINSTNTSVTESVTQSFKVSGFNNGTYSWKVSCTDNSTQQNTGNSSFRLLSVVNDLEIPLINLVAPSNQSSDSDGKVLFVYNVSDELNNISSCRLYIDNALQQTNSSIQENINQSFRISGLGDGTYQWFVNCTDNSDNQNIGESAIRTLVVQNDVVAPAVNLVNPPDHTLETDGNRTFFYNVSDAISAIAKCELIFNGLVDQTDTSVSEDVKENFTVTGLTDAQRNWSVNCTDNSENSNKGASSSRNITVTLDSAVPVINLVSPSNNTQSVSNNVTFIFNITDTSDISNCSIYINNTLNTTKYNLSKDTNVNFTINNFENVTIFWNIDCVDKSEDNFRGVSENRTLVIGADVIAPVINLVNPPNNIQDTDGNVLFEYNVTDFGSTIANCSLIINNTINQSNNSVQENIKQNFSTSNMRDGNYIWQVNCTDNSTNLNIGSSQLRNLTIGADTTAPTVTLTAPTNNTLYNSENVLYEYSVSDFASDIKNCSLIINNKINLTNTTIVETVSQFFNVYNQEDGNYNWSVNCTDVFNNTGASVFFNISIFKPQHIFVNVSINATAYEQGNIAGILVNVTNSSNAPFTANLTVDIIKGNATVPWWNTSFHFRVPYIINASSISRTDKLIELSINFTNILVNEIGLSGLTFDNNSIRVLEFDGNNSIEIASQFKGSDNFNNVNNSYGDLYWISNSTTQVNRTREYYIYFDVIENGEKSASVYSKPTFSFRGSTKSVSFDKSSISASHVIINKSNNSFTMLFADGDGIFNQLYTDYQGAGSLLNITVDGNRLTNDNSSIAPIAVKDDDYLATNSTSTVESGAVVSFVNINSSINSIADSTAQINYTIWFTNKNIYVRAKLYANFTSEEAAPIDLYSNLWFAYLFDEGDTSWNSFVNTLNSKPYNDTHSYLTISANLSELSAFRVSDWFSELKSGLGGINLYVQNFSLNNVNTTIGIISFDDARLPAGTQSDGVGFNLNSDQTIAAGDTYSITIWMRFSSEETAKAEDLENDIETPLITTRKQGQRLINRTINESDINGLFSMNFNTTSRAVGFYSAVARAFKSLYIAGINSKSFEITADITRPTVIAISPEGFIATIDTTFTFNVSETNSLNSCSLVLNNKANITNSSPINNAQNTLIVYNIAEGSYNWSVNCTDSAGNVGNSSTKNITVDYTKPSTTLNYPNASQVFTISNIEFNFTVTDNLDTNLTCNLTVNNVVNISDISAVNGTMTNITISGFKEDIHLWNVTCIDDSSNTNISPTRNFTISLGNPKFFPENTQSAINNSNPRKNDVLQISTNATDESSLSLVVFSWNDTGVWRNLSNASLNQKSVNYTVNVTVTAIRDKVVGYVFHAKDNSNNFNTTILRTFTVENSLPSTPRVIAPSNNSRNNKQPLEINVTFPADSDNDSITIYYYINGKLNQTSLTNTTLNASDGAYLLNVSLYDTINFSINVTINFTIDTIKPRINASINNSSPRRFEVVNMTANVTDETELSFCQFIINQSTNGAKEFFNKSVTGANDKCSQNFTITLIKGNVINFTVIVNDTANNQNQSQQVVTIINSPPSTLTVLFPTDLLNISQQPLSLNVTFPADSDNDDITIYYYINGKLNQTSSTNTTLNASDGNYKLNVSLSDGTEFSTNITVNFTIDTTNPVTTQQYPPNDYYNDTAEPFSLLFNCSSTDNIYLKNISLYITNRSNQSFSFNSTAKISGTSNYANWTLALRSGNYTWNCLTYDTADNFDWGDNRSLLINTSLLDLKVASGDIAFNNTSPIEDDNVTINATIFNKGSITAIDVVIQFFDSEPSNKIQIDTNHTISSLGALGNRTVNVTFKIPLGLHEIFVLVDPDNTIAESNETNNNASKNLTVPIWHTIAGNVTGNLLLQSIGNKTIFSWDTTAATSGNIFVVDSDSTITWANLTALGRNITGGNASNDWQELDTALNTSNTSLYLDSINRTFLLEYVPLNVTSFVVFANTIYNVSITNSTNNTNFFTGILWDQSDDATGAGNGQYNGSEDVVFITEISRNKTGKYGAYDFELKVPSLLKRYKGPDLTSVTFYVELK